MDRGEMGCKAQENMTPQHSTVQDITKQYKTILSKKQCSLSLCDSTSNIHEAFGCWLEPAYSKTHYSKTHYRTAQHTTGQHRAKQHSTLQNSTNQHPSVSEFRIS
jgi:hypothetical protein